MKKKAKLFFKRFADIFLSLLILIIFFPFLLVLAILIKLTSKGPVMFTHERPGKNRKLFKIYKLRTMYLGSETMVKGQEVLKDDDRITSIGKFLRRAKIDELPQILNIIKGEMSLIGPRPERVASLEEYNYEIEKRLNVRPGMTGLAQVSGNIYLELEDRYKYDVYYAEHFSILLDIKIILRTFGVVLFGEEKYKHKPLISIK